MADLIQEILNRQSSTPKAQADVVLDVLNTALSANEKTTEQKREEEAKIKEEELRRTGEKAREEERKLSEKNTEQEKKTSNVLSARHLMEHSYGNQLLSIETPVASLDAKLHELAETAEMLTQGATKSDEDALDTVPDVGEVQRTIDALKNRIAEVVRLEQAATISLAKDTRLNYVIDPLHPEHNTAYSAWDIQALDRALTLPPGCKVARLHSGEYVLTEPTQLLIEARINFNDGLSPNAVTFHQFPVTLPLGSQISFNTAIFGERIPLAQAFTQDEQYAMYPSAAQLTRFAA